MSTTQRTLEFTMNRILIALAPFLLTGCLPTMVGAALFVDAVDGGNRNDDDGYGYDTDDDYGYDTGYDNDDAFGDYETTYLEGLTTGELSGVLPGVGELIAAPATVDMWASSSTLDFDIRHTQDDGGWAMIGGQVHLDQALEDGQLIEVISPNVVGCSGSRFGEFDFDEAPVDPVIIVEENEDGDLQLTFDFPFAGGPDVVGVAILTDEG